MLPFGDVGLTASKPEPRLHRPSIQTYLRNHDGTPPSMRCTKGRKFIRALQVTPRFPTVRKRCWKAGNGTEGVSLLHRRRKPSATAIACFIRARLIRGFGYRLSGVEN